ncbi:tetratricopeptide repeat protein [Jiella marina]|uniref:tetratricopeptide repeat protein n=1 Tax=Jiella sp. LLJ827 TaxID=2917712 RepID=UPI0021014783|nr:tetratricopeptide repeat protein [Jiella sp. LLJ827]MCQ0989138.1 tetratricopeptide repeat protein [Jiella sp. LLJ827]
MSDMHDIEDLRSRALTARKSGNHEESLGLFRQLLEQHPADQRSWIDIAISLRELSRFSEARATLASYLSTDRPSNWRGLAVENLVALTEREIDELLGSALIDEANAAFRQLCSRLDSSDFATWTDNIWRMNFKILAFHGLESGSYHTSLTQLASGALSLSQRSLTLLAHHAIRVERLDDARALLLRIKDDLRLRLQLLEARQSMFAPDARDKELAEEAKAVHDPLVRKAGWAQEFYSAMHAADRDGVRRASEEMQHCLAAATRISSKFSISGIDKMRSLYASVFVATKNLSDLNEAGSLEEMAERYLRLDLKAAGQEKRVCLSQHYLSQVIHRDDPHIRMLDDGPEPDRRVPRSLVQFWDSAAVPSDVERCCRTWRAMAAKDGFDYAIFNEAEARDFLKTACGDDVARRFERAGHPAMKADLFRISYLYDRGGVYVDADEYLKSPPSFLTGAARCVRLQPITVPVELPNMYLALVRHDPLLHRLIDVVLGMPEDELLNGGIWWNTGPGLFSVGFARLHAEIVLGLGETLPQGIPRSLYTRHIAAPELDYKSTSRSWQVELDAKMDGVAR